ncbi:MAG: BspA family leucine-rich repeat surface protein, partial [Bacilli bacterium]|nr:BspA family leucine-rich repeat surface protein [Bacilli bacterium]
MIVCKYKFDSNIYSNLIPEFNSGYNGYSVNDTVDGNIITRTIECDTLPTLMRFGVATNDTPTSRELSLLEVIELDTAELTSCKRMFIGCQNVTSINTEGWTLNKVTDMYAMFYNCNNLTTLDVSNFNTSQVTSMYCMFYNCTNLTQLDVSNFDTSKVTNMHAMFNNCKNLTQLDVSNFNTSNVTNMGYMFT